MTLLAQPKEIIRKILWNLNILEFIKQRRINKTINAMVTSDIEAIVTNLIKKKGGYSIDTTKTLREEHKDIVPAQSSYKYIRQKYFIPVFFSGIDCSRDFAIMSFNEKELVSFRPLFAQDKKDNEFLADIKNTSSVAEALQTNEGIQENTKRIKKL